MVSELAGEGATSPQLPKPASHAELQVGLGRQIRSSLRRGVDSAFNLSAVLSFQSRVSRSRFVKSLSKVLINSLFVVFNRSSRRKSVRSSAELVIPLFDLVSLSKVLVISLFTVSIRSRSAEILSAELVAVVSSPQRRTRKKKQLLTQIRDFAFEKSQGERRVSDMKNRVGKLRSEIEAPNVNIEEAMRFQGAVVEIDSWSRSMDTNLRSVVSKQEQVVLSCSLVTPPLAILRLVLGSAPTERLCQAISMVSEMSFSSTFSSHSAMVNVCVEENKKSLIWIWLVLIAITCCESAVIQQEENRVMVYCIDEGVYRMKRKNA